MSNTAKLHTSAKTTARNYQDKTKSPIFEKPIKVISKSWYYELAFIK